MAGLRTADRPLHTSDTDTVEEPTLHTEHDPSLSTSSTPVQIRFADVDMARHVHNAVYFQWFELARMEYLARFIPPEHDWGVQGLILARNECDHRMPVQLHDRINAEAWCSAIGTKSFDLRYRIHRTNGERPGICAEGRSVMVCFDYKAGRPIELPIAWRDILEKHLVP
jgi:acyl-CoA thioester hydrolase